MEGSVASHKANEWLDFGLLCTCTARHALTGRHGGRRTADAVGVANWMVGPRERNRTAHETLRVVLSTLQDMEWKARESPLDGAKWAAVTAYMQMDVRYCRQVSEVANREQIAQSAV
jgi:hypothetical protein